VGRSARTHDERVAATGEANDPPQQRTATRNSIVRPLCSLANTRPDSRIVFSKYCGLHHVDEGGGAHRLMGTDPKPIELPPSAVMVPRGQECDVLMLPRLTLSLMARASLS